MARRRASARNTPGGTHSAGDRARKWIELAAAAVVVIGGIFALVRFLADSGEDLLGTTAASQIEVRQVVVVNGRTDSRLVNGGFLQTEASTPQLDITVRNTGKNPALLTEVRITVEDSARLAVCEYHTGDAVAVSREYAVRLPLLPAPGERIVTHPLHQEVPAGSVDRFKVFFRVPRAGEANYVYALRVALIAEDSGKAIDVGRFVIGVPESANRGGRILPEGADPFGALDSQERLMSTWCGRRNLAALDRLLRRPGRRSPSMAALTDFRPAGWWASFVDRRSPREAVEPLLREQLGEGPILAVFAAERTGDPRLVEEARRRAAISLLTAANEALESGYSYAVASAVLAAHYALLFQPSPEVRETLARAEASLEAAEAETSPAGFE